MISLSSEKANVFIVAGLLFGDEGKGTTTEYLCSHAKAKLVVRYSGGPQAMHHVVTTKGEVHCFSQFGSGHLFPETKTLLSKYMFISPHTLLNEMEALQKIEGATGIAERLYMDKESFIITPLHQLVNRVLEVLRGEVRYGTTGMGVGIAVDDAFGTYPQFFPTGLECEQLNGKMTPKVCLRMGDIQDKSKLTQVLQGIYNEKRDMVRDILKNYKSSNFAAIFDNKYMELHHGHMVYKEELYKEASDIFLTFLQKYPMSTLVSMYQSFAQIFASNIVDGTQMLKHHLDNKDTVIFEGAQGALLDRIYGIYPHLTRTLCSEENAIELLKQTNSQFQLLKIGVLRSYSSRHGNGPFVTNDEEWLKIIPEMHNQTTKWQGKFRIGPFDAVAAQYGTQIFKADVISLTCLDRLIEALMKNENSAAVHLDICTGYASSVSSELVQRDEQQTIVRIHKKDIQQHYKNLELLKVLQHAQPVITCPQLTSNDELLSSSVEQYVMTKYGDSQIAKKMAEFVVKCQQVIGLPIAVLSFGPTYLDKTTVQAR